MSPWRVTVTAAALVVAGCWFLLAGWTAPGAAMCGAALALTLCPECPHE